MYRCNLIGALVLFVTSVDVKCESGEDNYEPDYRPNTDGPTCDTENQIALAEVKSEIKILQELIVGLRKKLDPDFKWSPPPKIESKCPPGFQYVSLARSCYQVVYEEHNWTSADQRCRDLHPKAHLVAITKKDENSALQTYLKQELSAFDLVENSHIDVCKLDWWGYPSQMLWTSGRQLNETSCKEPFFWNLSNNTQLPLSFTHWLRNEPNCHQNKEPCIHLIPMFDFSWNDARCSEMLCPLCEFDPS